VGVEKVTVILGKIVYKWPGDYYLFPGLAGKYQILCIFCSVLNDVLYYFIKEKV
jgi:hypothetical protein